MHPDAKATTRPLSLSPKAQSYNQAEPCRAKEKPTAAAPRPSSWPEKVKRLHFLTKTHTTTQPHSLLFPLLSFLRIVKIIKFYAWELAIEDKVKELRDKDVHGTKKPSLGLSCVYQYANVSFEELVLQLRYKLWNVAGLLKQKAQRF